jgi:hypothetical protein
MKWIMLLWGCMGFAYAQNKSEKEVLDICQQKFAAMVNQDTLLLKTLLHDSLVYIHSSGKADTKASLIATVTHGTTIYKQLDVFEARVRGTGKTVVVTAKLHYSAVSKSDTKTYDLLFTEVYVKQGKKWLLFSRHASKI